LGALQDPSKTVRYYAALQLGGLGKDLGKPAVPVLKDILVSEKDDDLVERAKLALLRLEPSALTEERPPLEPRPSASPRSLVAPRASPAARATWIRVRVYEKGEKRPQVSINMPLGLAELVFKSLPDDAVRELKQKGYDAENFWQRLMKLGPTEILTVEQEDGGRVQIWLE
jgi:hypothetical protein